MAELYNNAVQQWEDVDDALVQDSVNEGTHSFGTSDDVSILVTSEDGGEKPWKLPPEKARLMMKHYGAKWMSPEDKQHWDDEKEYGEGFTSAAMGLGVLDAAFPFASKALEWAGVPGVEEIIEHNPNTHLATDILGSIGFAVLATATAGPFGAAAAAPGVLKTIGKLIAKGSKYTLPGFSAKVGQKVTTKLGEKLSGKSLLAAGEMAERYGLKNVIKQGLENPGAMRKVGLAASGIGARLGGIAAENFVFGAGYAVTEADLGDPLEAAEYILTEASKSAAIGTALGVVLSPVVPLVVGGLKTGANLAGGTVNMFTESNVARFVEKKAAEGVGKFRRMSPEEIGSFAESIDMSKAGRAQRDASGEMTKRLLMIRQSVDDVANYSVEADQQVRSLEQMGHKFPYVKGSIGQAGEVTPRGSTLEMAEQLLFDTPAITADGRQVGRPGLLDAIRSKLDLALGERQRHIPDPVLGKAKVTRNPDKPMLDEWLGQIDDIERGVMKHFAKQVDESVEHWKTIKPDNLYMEAIAAVVDSGRASASFLQKALKIDKKTAGKLIKQMEDEQIIGPVTYPISKGRAIVGAPPPPPPHTLKNWAGENLGHVKEFGVKKGDPKSWSDKVPIPRMKTKEGVKGASVPWGGLEKKPGRDMVSHNKGELQKALKQYFAKMRQSVDLNDKGKPIKTIYTGDKALRMGPGYLNKEVSAKTFSSLEKLASDIKVLHDKGAFEKHEANEKAAKEVLELITDFLTHSGKYPQNHIPTKGGTLGASGYSAWGKMGERKAGLNKAYVEAGELRKIFQEDFLEKNISGEWVPDPHKTQNWMDGFRHDNIDKKTAYWFDYVARLKALHGELLKTQNLPKGFKTKTSAKRVESVEAMARAQKELQESIEWLNTKGKAALDLQHIVSRDYSAGEMLRISPMPGIAMGALGGVAGASVGLGPLGMLAGAAAGNAWSYASDAMLSPQKAIARIHALEILMGKTKEAIDEGTNKYFREFGIAEKTMIPFERFKAESISRFPRFLTSNVIARYVRPEWKGEAEGEPGTKFGRAEYENARIIITELAENRELKGQIYQTVLGSLDGVAPKVKEQMTAQLDDYIDSIYKSMPKRHDMGPLNDPEPPSDQAIQKWGQILSIREYGIHTILRGMRTGTLTNDEISEWRDSHPGQFKQFVSRVLEIISDPEKRKALPASTKATLMRFLGESPVSPAFSARLQETYLIEDKGGEQPGKPKFSKNLPGTTQEGTLGVNERRTAKI